MTALTLKIPQRSQRYDVVVVGGGLTGVCAATAAAREGARVILLEADGALGGMATQGLVPGWCGVHNKKEVIHSSLCQRILRESSAESARHDYIHSAPPIDAERLKRGCDTLVTQSGAELLFRTTVVGVQKEGDRLQSVYLANKNGITALSGAAFVDCTGDADLAAWAEAGYDKGDETGDLQPVSLCFAISGIDPDKIADELQTHPGWGMELVDDPAFPLIQDTFFGLGDAVGPSLRTFNSGHLWGVDSTNPASVTQAFMKGRELAHQLFLGYKKYMPEAFRNATLICTAPQMGVRESRRIHGEYQLTRADYDTRRRFADEISFGCFFIDVHPSLEKRRLERQGGWSWNAEMKDSCYGEGEFFSIPYRCLQPKGVANLLVAGRSISSDREVNGALRIMPSCMSMGEAAGIAAALSVARHEGRVRQCSVAAIQKAIRANGGFMPEQIIGI